MPVQSMTGYGRAEQRGETWSVTIELKSVNNRFLEFQTRNGKDLLFLENRLRAELNQYVSRGTVTCHVHYESQSPEAGSVAMNHSLFRSYLQLLEAMKKTVPDAAPINLVELLRIPELVVPGFSHESPETVEGRVLPVFQKACEELVLSRRKEGDALAADLRSRIEGFSPGMERIKALLPERQADFVSRMRARIQELLGDRNLAEDRLLTEIGILAERLDITEEIVRLSTHLQHFLETLFQHKAPGKRLGFLLQEMLREVNTMGTKSQYPEFQQICIGWKEELEIIREQIQNLE